MSQFVREFRDEVSLLQRFNQEQQMIFLLITAGSTKRKERKHTGAHVVRSNLSSAWASCNLFGLQALIRSLIQLVALLGTSIGGRRPPRPRHGSSRLPEAKKSRQVHISGM